MNEKFRRRQFLGMRKQSEGRHYGVVGPVVKVQRKDVFVG